MAHLKAVTYNGLKNLFAGSYKTELKIGNNTTAAKTGDKDEPTFIVALHGYSIVELTPDETKFSLAGWPTVTTRDRINQFLPLNHSVFQADHEQFYNGVPIDSYEWVTMEDR